MKYRAFFFDFDGVIAESVNVKTEAFYQIYFKYGEEIAEKVKAHHLANGGMSRFEKIKLYRQGYLQLEPDAEAEKQDAESFSSLVVQKVIESPFVDGAISFLEEHHTTKDQFVISGTPTSELRQIIAARNLDKYFLQSYGSPESKHHWINHILNERGYAPQECLFFGDAKADFNAAQQGETDFILRETPENIELFKDYKGRRFSTFAELKDLNISA